MTYADQNITTPMNASARLPPLVLGNFAHADHALLGLTLRRSYPLRDQRLGQFAHGDLASEEDTLTFSDAFAPLKPLADVVVLGSAHAGSAAQEHRVHVQVGPLSKRLRVVGPRHIERSSGALRFSAPQSFTSMPLSWSNAFGGTALLSSRKGGGRWAARDEAGEDEEDAYPRNPFGRGYAVAGGPDELAGLRLPSLEDAEHPLTIEHLDPARPWHLRPLAESLGPLDPFMFPRIAYWVPLAMEASVLDELAEVRLGWASREVCARGEPVPDVRAYLCGARGLTGALTGGEPYELAGLHPETEILRGALPKDQPRMALELEGVGRIELAPTLKTVAFRPSEGTVTLTWAAAQPVLVPYAPDELARVGVLVDGRPAEPTREAVVATTQTERNPRTTT
ncbi:MAG: DUF2169 domain-containing protein [Polyangiaceae bacterium]|nr:DUF2169 domain-containing protein [Polyangiaceae bacterium]